MTQKVPCVEFSLGAGQRQRRAHAYTGGC